MPSPKFSDAEDEMSFYLRQSQSLQHQRVSASPSSPSRNRVGSQTVPHRRLQQASKFVHTTADRSPARTPIATQSSANSHLLPKLLPRQTSQTEAESDPENLRDVSPSKGMRTNAAEYRSIGYIERSDAGGNYTQHDCDLKRSTDFESAAGGHCASPARSQLRSSNAIDVASVGRKSPDRLRYLPPITRRSDTSRDVEVWDASLPGVVPTVSRRSVTKAAPVRLSGCRSMSPTHQSPQLSADCLSESVLTILQRIEHHLTVPTPLELWASRQFQREEAGERRRCLKHQLFQCVDKVDAKERIVEATRQWPEDVDLIIEVLIDCLTGPTSADRPQWLAVST